MFRGKMLIAIVLLFAVSFLHAEGEKYGKEITLKEKTSVSNILEQPDKFSGKTVLVEGSIVEVCQKMGCWMEIAGEKENQKIMIKVEDGEIVFPKDAKGKTALVEGVVTEVLPEAEAEHSHEDHEGDDACSVKEKTYRIKGLGAVIK